MPILDVKRKHNKSQNGIHFYCNYFLWNLNISNDRLLAEYGFPSVRIKQITMSNNSGVMDYTWIYKHQDKLVTNTVKES